MTNASTRSVIIGAGLAGLTAATLLARAGVRVRVLELSPKPGGRALSQVKEGYCLNMGPHALYRKGHAARILARLGVEPRGRVPSLVGQALNAGRSCALPTGVGSLMTTSLLTLGQRLEAMGLMGRMMAADPSLFEGMSLDEWLEKYARHPQVRELVRALIRLSTYAAQSRYLSAGTAIAQFQLASHGVRYVDGGWQSLVDGLQTAAEAAGVR
ncbi:MAG TPA: FAD-dependent oxidoreductase, partial [Stenomitos sp.]